MLRPATIKISQNSRSLMIVGLAPFESAKVINSDAYHVKLPPNPKQHQVINLAFLHPYRQSEQFPHPHPDSV